MTKPINAYPNFPNQVGRTREESVPHWPPEKAAQCGSPNIVVLYLDDMGYSDIGCFGSEIETPHIDALAQRGVRFNHYTTHPMCSPARAALLTGRNAHAVGTGWLASNNPGFPGYSGAIPLAAPTMAETFRAAGYATFCVGKWHNATNRAEPNDSWPSQRGFEQFYGCIDGEINYFAPARLLYNNMTAPIDQYPDRYYTTDDWTDKSMQLLRELRHERPDKPFLLYLAYNAPHSPLQAKEVDLKKYRGRYDRGWDLLRSERLTRQKALGLVPKDAQLSPRDPAVPAWEDLPADSRALFARHMEVYAAMLDCVDQNVGRFMAQLTELGELDDTIIVFASDNGGTGAGGANGEVFSGRRFAGTDSSKVAVDFARLEWIGTDRAAPLYPTGWGQLSNTPFPSYKTYTGGGGRRVSLILSWPANISRNGQILKEFAHVTDIMPTLLDLAGVAALETSHGQQAEPMDGSSLAPLLLHDDASVARREQYYECWANRAYWRDGWLAVSLQKRGVPIDFKNWTLHNLATDFSESDDLADKYPERLNELVESFDNAAWRNLVYPLDNRLAVEKYDQLPEHMQPAKAGFRRFLPGSQTITVGTILPLVSDRSYRIVARICHGADDMGVVFAIGDIYGGMVLFVENGDLHFLYNGFGEFVRVKSKNLAMGNLSIGLDYEASGERKGRGRLIFDEVPLTEWSAMNPTMASGLLEGLDIGIDRRAPVDWELFQRHGSFPYTGKIRDVTIEHGGFAPDSPLAREQHADASTTSVAHRAFSE